MKSIFTLVVLCLSLIQCSREEEVCVCSQSHEFLLGEIIPIARFKELKSFNSGESTKIKFSITQNDLCKSTGIEVKLLNGEKIIFRKIYEDGTSISEISVPSQSNLTLDASLKTLDNKIECVWLGSATCILEY